MSAGAITISHPMPVNATILWEELRHIDRHVQWMADAESIEFEGDQREGVGTSFRCRTKIGPFVTVDRMTITSWVERREMGVTHQGLVTGVGKFTVLDGPNDTCVLTWQESLRFPWWALGPIGATLARPVLQFVWRKNLQRLEGNLPS